LEATLWLKNNNSHFSSVVVLLMISNLNHEKLWNLQLKMLLQKSFKLNQPITSMNSEENLVVIEKVEAKTFNDFLNLIDKLAEYEKLAPPNEDAKKRLREDYLCDKPKYQAFVGKLGQKYVSYVIFFYTYSSFLALPSLFLEDIFVLEEYRRLGVGKKMFDFVKESAKRETCSRIEFTVLKWNKSAQNFYEKNRAKRLEWFLYRLVKEDF
jgi:GNAT superfamily N-acetyltransferase